jgi:hypothetical protein
MQVRIALRHGVWTDVEEPTRTLAEMRAERRERLGFSGDPGAGLYSTTIARRLEHSCLDPFLARLYTKHVSVGDEAEAYRLLDAGRAPDVLIAEGAEPGSLETPYAGSERVELTHASFNRLVLDVRAAAPSWLELCLPHSRHWRARVGGAPAEIVRASGAYQAVRVPPGASAVEFRYESRATELGMLIAALGLVATAAWISSGALRPAPRLALIALASAVAIGGLSLWRASLYSGTHLGTRYTWTPPAAGTRLNLAFQRPTQMSPFYPSTWDESQALGRTPDPFGSGTAVDGQRDPRRAFRTTVTVNPHWIVDLAGAPLVGEVVVCDARLGPEADARLAVELWSDGAWVRVAESRGVDPTLERYAFAPRRAARVRLQTSGTRALSASEIEVYGPEP